MVQEVPPSITASAIFAEDIRQEIHGRVSLIGVLTSDLKVPSLPITVPKLAIFYTIRIPVGTEVTQLAVIVRDSREKTILELTVPDSDLNRMVNDMKNRVRSSSRFHNIYMQAVHGPLILDASGAITAFAFINNKKYRAGGIWLELEHAIAPTGIATLAST